MTTLFIITAIVMSATVGAFISLMVVNTFLENGKFAVKIIVGAILSLCIGCFVSGGLMLEKTGDEELWNNGYCVECEQPYTFANAEHRRNGSTIYFWNCDNCGKVISLHHNFLRK